MRLIKKESKNFFLLNKKENSIFILNCIFNNLNFNYFLRFNVFLKLNLIKEFNRNVHIVGRCYYTGKKKMTNIFSRFSRLTILKLLRSGAVYGFLKSSW